MSRRRRSSTQGPCPLNTYVPGLATRTRFPLPDAPEHPMPFLWIGGRSRIAAHFDSLHNLANVVAGRRRFTLFPPEQISNLYIGPIDFTPAGQPLSIVDFMSPDLARFPKFETAMAAARVAVLAPGDAFYIPQLWWHHVESLDRLGAMINFWWGQSPIWAEPPMNALLHALLAMGHLDAPERAAWRTVFDHYVFDRPEGVVDHIPEHARGIAETLNRPYARRLRATLLQALNR